MTKMKKYILTLMIIALSCNIALAQKNKSVTVKGTVYSLDSDGRKEALPYASIFWLEKGTYMEANIDGKFEFMYFEGQKSTLVATAIGFGKDTVEIKSGMTSVEFVLKGENEIGQAKVVARNEGNFLSKVAVKKTEVISAAGLCKMACCNLAESFENSASVSVGFSDAVTGARQIQLLGLSGSYTQMLDENRPVMRGLASPFGLTYVPGQWLESIQIAKGPSSVINGFEAITGQINMEHRKPTDEVPFFANLLFASSLRTEANIASSLQINKKWSTVLLGHFSIDPMAHDGDVFDKNAADGFRDDPYARQFNFANRWLYYDESGLQVRFGVKVFHDKRRGGMMEFDDTYGNRTSLGIDDVNRKFQYKDAEGNLVDKYGLWGTSIRNKGVNPYFKIGIPLDAENNHNIAIVGDYNYYQMNSFFGLKNYDGIQNSGFLNVIFQGTPNENHRYSIGIRNQFDDFNEHLLDRTVSGENGNKIIDYEKDDFNLSRRENSIGLYGEYTYTLGDKFTAVADMSVDYNNIHGWLFAPRANLKYSFTDWLVVRAAGGRGYRSPNVVVDNLGMLSTGRRINIADNLDIEDAWTYGANITGYFPLPNETQNNYISFDYFRTDFVHQIIADQEVDTDNVYLYNVDGPSFTNTYQVDFSIEPIERFTIMATFRYTDAKVSLKGQGLVDRPLTSKYKGVLNLQYATRMNIWTFDFTAQLNGPARLPNYAVKEGESNYSPVYPVLYAQITRKFKGFDIYIGAENLLNFRQKNPIINANDPYSTAFNASAIWGPLMGIKAHIGMRFTLWK